MLSPEKVAKLQAAGLEIQLMPLRGSTARLPLYLSPVQAGTPALAESDLAGEMNLGDWLAPYPDRSFLVRVRGDSMVDFGIFDGDLLVVETGRRPRKGEILVAEIHGAYTVKRLGTEEGKPVLLAGNPKYPSIPIVPGEMRIGGVVRSVVRRYGD